MIGKSIMDLQDFKLDKPQIKDFNYSKSKRKINLRKSKKQYPYTQETTSSYTLISDWNSKTNSQKCNGRMGETS